MNAPLIESDTVLRDPVLRSLPRVAKRYPEARILRYRPSRRCTLRAFRDGEHCIVKVFADARGELLHAQAQLLWQAAQRGELDFRVARPLDWDPDLFALTQSVLPGEPVAPSLFGTSGAELAHRMGRAAASLPASALAPPARFDANVQFARTQGYATAIRAQAPELVSSIARTLERFQAFHAKLSSRPLRAIHGAPHPHQWLRSDDKLGLVDFDRFSMGDPELDVATFLGEMDFETPTVHPIAAINGAFLAGYESRYGLLDTSRLALYHAHKRFAKVYRLLRGTKPDATTRARCILDGIGSMLSESPA